MKSWKLNTWLIVGLQGLLLLGGLVAAASMSANDRAKQTVNPPKGPLIRSLQGPDLYRAYCASCHGADATGSGPAASALVAKPSDLTTIAQRNGGAFPAARIRRVIAGDEVVASHGSREMPVWGPIFHEVEEDRDYGHIRLQNVTNYLQTLQKR